MPTRPTPEPRPSYLIGRLHRVLRRTLDESLRAQGLTAAQYTALSLLGEQPGLSNAQLARRSFMTSQAAHQTLLALVALDLVDRQQDPDHARIARATLTTRGARVLVACDRAVDAAERAMLASIRSERQRALLADLRACLRALDPTYRG